MSQPPSQPASAGDNATAAFLRMHIAYELNNVRSLVGFRTCCLLRGIRGVDGTRWAAQVLREPPLYDFLQDTRLACSAKKLQNIVRGLLAAHEKEEQRRIFQGETPASAARFSQHHEGQDAGHRGKCWLEAAESDASALQMAMCLAQVQMLLPMLWLGDRVPRAAKPIREEDLLTLLTLFAKR